MKGGEGRGEKGKEKNERGGERNLIVRIFWMNTGMNYYIYFI